MDYSTLSPGTSFSLRPATMRLSPCRALARYGFRYVSPNSLTKACMLSDRGLLSMPALLGNNVDTDHIRKLFCSRFICANVSNLSKQITLQGQSQTQLTFGLSATASLKKYSNKPLADVAPKPGD
jgi:hypothetical protein